MRGLVIILVLAALGGGGWWGYQHFYAAPEGNEYVLKTLTRGDIVRTVSATGTVEPLIKVIVGSQVSGNIIKWYADFNATVKAGSKLAEIDPQRFRTALDQAQADLALARAGEEEAKVKYEDAERERKRLATLKETASASDNELLVSTAVAEGAKAAWHGASAKVSAAEASVRAAQVDLDRTVIHSPIDGVVISRDIDVGQTVAASLQAPTLFTIANDLTSMEVDANVSEADIGLIREGMPARFIVDAYPGRKFEGTISQIRYNATVLDSVVTYVTIIQVRNQDMALRPGMTANVTFEVAKVENVVRIPTAALRFSPTMRDSATGPAASQRAGGPTVYQLVGGQPRPMSVKIGLTDGAFTQMMDGEVREGDEVITDKNWSRAKGRADMTSSMSAPRRT